MQCRVAQAVNPHATTSVAQQRSKAVSHAPGAQQELLNAANGSVSLLAVVSCISSNTAMLMPMKIQQSEELVNNPNRNSKRDQQYHWKRTPRPKQRQQLQQQPQQHQQSLGSHNQQKNPNSAKQRIFARTNIVSDLAPTPECRSCRIL